MENLEVWVVTVFNSGDFTTSPWGAYFDKSEAEACKADLLNSELNQDGNYLTVEISKLKVEKKFEADED